MTHTGNKCVLWIGDKHCGKTTAATNLVESFQKANFTVGGILSPSVYKNGELTGFDIIDIFNGVRMPLSVRDENIKGCVPFRYCQKGLSLGHRALEPIRNKSANLVIVDEYGPLELNSEGWRVDVDNLLITNCLPVLLVVRRSLVDKVMKLYRRHICLLLEALDSDSINKMLDFVFTQCNKRNKTKIKSEEIKENQIGR